MHLHAWSQGPRLRTRLEARDLGGMLEARDLGLNVKAFRVSLRLSLNLERTGRGRRPRGVVRRFQTVEGYRVEDILLYH